MKLSILMVAFSLSLCLAASAYVDEPQAKGDLVFRKTGQEIYGKDGFNCAAAGLHPGHVGIYVGNGMVVHALGWDVITGEVVFTPLAPSSGQRSFYDDEGMDGQENHAHLGAKTHQGLRNNPQADTLRANIRHLALLQVGAGYDNDFSVQKGPGSDEWTCCGLTEKVYESCESPTELVYPSPYGNEAGYSGGLNITPDAFVSHDGDDVCYYQSVAEFSQMSSVSPLGRTFPGYSRKFIFFPYTQFQQPTLIDAFLMGPSDLSGSAVSSSQINLIWVDNDEKETGFRVQCRVGTSGSWVQKGTSRPVNTTTYSDTGLAADQTYYYRVIAYNASGSTTSSVISVTTQPAAGTSHTLTITTVNPASGVYVATWSDADSYDDGYSPLSRSFDHGSAVWVLCDDTLDSGQIFQKWQLDGADYAYSILTTVVMDGGHTLRAVYGATPPPIRTLSSLAIEGPSGVDEQSSAQYLARATYTDGSSGYVGADWNVDSGSASISGSGLLDADAVSSDEDIVIDANYSEGGVTRTKTKTVTIYNTDVVATYTLTCNSTVGGSIGYSPHASSYAAGTVVSLHGNPGDDYVFDYWSGDASGTEDDITITMNGNRSVTAHFTLDTSYGRLQVNLSPPQAVAEGAQWKYNNFTAWRDSGNIQDGITPRTNKSIYFKDIAGWTTPDSVKASVIGGHTTVTNATYREILGGVQVVITPDQANAAGARWRLDGGAWKESGVTLADISTGNHAVQFLAVTGWTAPTSQTVSVARGIISTRTGEYAPPVGLPIVTAVYPRTGPIEGGTVVTIDGANFQSGATVTFGGVAAASVTVVSSTRITAVTPSRASYGTVALSLTSGGQTVTQANGFSYLNALGSNIELVGQIGGDVYAVAVVGNMVYYGEGPGLVVSDFSNSAAPVERGRIALPNLVKDIAVVSNMAFVATGGAGLYAVDVSSPTAPSIVGFFDTEGSACGVSVVDGIAYIADDTAGLQVLSVTNPASIVRLGLLDTAGRAMRIAVGRINSKSYAFVAESSSDGAALRVIEISMPSNPVELANIPAQSTAGITDVKLVGTKLYAGGWGDVKIYDASNPTNLVQTGSYGNVAAAFFDVVGNRIYTCDGHFQVGDLAASPNPPTLGDFNPGWYCYDVFVTNNLAFVAMGSEGLKAISISNPASLSVRSAIDTLGGVESVWVSGSIAYLGGFSGLYSIDVSNLAHPIRLATLPGESISEVAVASGKATLVNANDISVRIANVANPSSLSLLGTYTNIMAQSVALLGNTPVLAGITPDASHRPILDVLNLSSPSVPSRTGSVLLDGTNGYTTAITVLGNWAFVGRQNKALDVISLANPASPLKIGSVPVTNVIMDIAASTNGDIIYIADLTCGIQLVDVSVKATPVLGQFIDLPQTAQENAWSVKVESNRLFATVGGFLFVFDISTPSSPQLLAYYDIPGTGYGIAATNDLIFVAGSHSGVTILRLMDIDKPTVAITTPTINASYATTNSLLSLGGTASDDKGVVRVSWENNRGGGGVASGTTTWTVSTVQLASGVNRVTVTAEDADGNMSSDVIEITTTFSDTTPPAVVITGPKPDSQFTVDTPTITLSGSAVDNQTVSGMTCSNNLSAAGAVTINGQTWSVTNLQLTRGLNIIQVTATDPSGNHGSDSAAVFYVPPDTNAPAVTIEFPTINPTFETRYGTINLSGTAKDDNQVREVNWASSGGTQGVATGVSPWSVNDIPLQMGFNLIEISAKDEAGNVSADTLSVVYAPQPSGSLTVTLEPADAASTGAQWSVDGDFRQNSGSTVSELDVGTHEVSFSTINGFITPSNQTVMISDGESTSATGTYTAIPPVLSVNPESQDFGPVLMGSTTDRMFTVTNTGGGLLSGSASVAAPFSVVSNGTYNLGASAGQAVTVRYSPQTLGDHSNAVVFTGGDGASLPVTGHAYALRTLVVASRYGATMPPVGTNTFATGSQITGLVTNSPVVNGTTQYVCTGWAGTGDAPSSGTDTNTGAFTITTNSALTWRWSTNYWLATASSGGGSVNIGDGWRPRGSNVQITATAAETNHFAGWTGQTNGCTFSSNVITAPMTQARAITANFAPGQFSLIIATKYGNGSPAAGTNWYNRDAVETATLTNSPAFNGKTTQYVCIGWTGTGSAPATGTTTNTGPFTITNNSAIAWRWVTNYWLATATSGGGSVDEINGWWPRGSNALITATAVETNHFAGWTGQTNGCTLNGNVITAPMTQARAITANFAPGQFSLIVATKYGNGSPAAGTNWYDRDAVETATLTNSPVVNGTTQYMCTGWAGTGDLPSSGTITNTGPFTITTNSTIAWQWSTNFWLAIAMNGSGSVDVADGWQPKGFNVQITATASESNHFAGWTGQTNGCTFSNNVITVPITQVRAITANFAIGPCSLIVTTPYGNSSPAAGTNWYVRDASATIALTNSPVVNGTTQFICVGWAGMGSVQESGVGTNAGPFTITNNSTLAWLWGTNYWLGTTANGSGSLNVAAGWWPRGSNAQITATAADHYYFSGWTGQTNGCTLSGNVITAPMTQARAITGNFALARFTLAVTTPYGKASPTGTTTNNWGTSVTAALTNSPVVNGTTQYVCTGWEGTGDVPSIGTTTNTGPFTITTNSTVAWQWSSNFWLAVGTNGSGSVDVTNQWCPGGSNVLVTAMPSALNRFTGWSGNTNGCAITSNQIMAPMDRSRAITAIFIKQFSLAVETPYGQGTPPVGTNWYDSGASVTARLTNSPVNNGTTQYVCRGWTGTGSVAANGATTNAGSFAITGDSTIIWLWRTNYWLHVDKMGDGTVSTNDTWLLSGTNFQVTASPAIYFTFGEWRGQTNGCIMASNRIMVAMDGARTVAAIFNADLASNNVPKWWLAEHDLTNFNADAMGDDDGDGMPTWQEWIAGSDPTNIHSKFQFTNEVCAAEQGMAIRWPSISNRFYNLSRATNLLDGSNAFIILPGASNIPATPPENSYTNEDQYDGFYFFRIGVRE